MRFIFSILLVASLLAGCSKYTPPPPQFAAVVTVTYNERRVGDIDGTTIIRQLDTGEVWKRKGIWGSVGDTITVQRKNWYR